MIPSSLGTLGLGLFGEKREDGEGLKKEVEDAVIMALNAPESITLMRSSTGG